MTIPIKKGKATRNAPAPEIPIVEAMGKAQARWNAGQADQAEILCQKILSVWPGHADASHLLGIMAHSYGNLDVAIAHLRKACEAPRAPAIYHSNLAEMCRQRGLLAEGEDAARRAVQLDPIHAAAWNNLGIILQEAGKYAESKNCLERVLTLQPHNADAHNNLGNTCKRLGQLTAAEKNWQRALKLRPNYAEPHSNLANLLTAQGEYARAATHARTAIELNPRLADAYINLAGVEMAWQNYREVLRWLNALFSFAPNHAGGLAANATALKKLDRLDEALIAADKALAASPGNADAHNARGSVLQAMGQIDLALAAYALAAAMPGTAAEAALINRALLFIEQGEPETARAAFQAALIAFPRSASAWFNQADSHKFVESDPAIAAMQNLLDDPEEISRDDKMLLHFALGKAFLDCKQSDLAFAHLDQGNAMKRVQLNYSPDATSQWMEQVAQVFSPARLDGFAGAGAPSKLPVFVVGMPRSGTTLVEQILASHHAIHGAGELNHIQNFVEAIGGFPQVLERMDRETLHRLGRSYLALVAPLCAGKAHVIDKMPVNFVYAGLIRLMLPDAKIIHCRRDPVDTCLSCYTKLFTAEQSFSYDQAELGRFHLDYQKLTAHWRAALPPTHFLEVDYEAVVYDVELQARRMLEFIGQPWDPACLDFHRTKRAVRTASVNQVRQPIYRSSAGRGRAYGQHLGPLLQALKV